MAVRAIDGKYAMGAELTDTDFDAGVLSRFRARLAEHCMDRMDFDRLLAHRRDAAESKTEPSRRVDRWPG